MLISHEVPISLLKKSKSFNDYDYCLLHLTYEYPEYEKFFINSIKEGRKVLLDNSLYELGDSLTNEQLAEGVLKMNPAWFVVPDCLNNKNLTIERFKNFIENYGNVPGLKIGVVQGSTEEELIECYKYMSDNADKIGIPFGSCAYDAMFNDENILQKRTYGRIKFINDLIAKNIWNWEKPHHLLGCNWPIEFSFYEDINNIESIDTSNPIINGILNKDYQPTFEIKPTEKICDLIDINLTIEQEEQILKNVKDFRRSVERSHL